MGDSERWVARIVPLDRTVNEFLRQPHGLDIWERQPGALIAAAESTVLDEVEHQGLARVERISTLRDYVRTRSPDQE